MHRRQRISSSRNNYNNVQDHKSAQRRSPQKTRQPKPKGPGSALAGGAVILVKNRVSIAFGALHKTRCMNLLRHVPYELGRTPNIRRSGSDIQP